SELASAAGKVETKPVPPAPAVPAAPTVASPTVPSAPATREPSALVTAEPEAKTAPAARPSVASRLVPPPRMFPATEADEIAPPPGEITPERIPPPDHDTRLAANARLTGRFPTHLPRPRLAQPMAPAGQAWRSELQEDTHRHLTSTQREESELVAPL